VRHKGIKMKFVIVLLISIRCIYTNNSKVYKILPNKSICNLELLQVYYHEIVIKYTHLKLY